MKSPTGLLARLRQTWRRPDDRAGQVAGPGEESAGLDQQVLKEALAQRRRNEQVRQREFEHLRQLRQRGIGISRQAGGSQLSLFDTALSAQSGERVQMLRKIEQAEASMARVRWAPPSSHGRTAIAAGGALPRELSDTTLMPTDAGTLPPWPRAGTEAEAARSAGFVVTEIPAMSRHVPGPDRPLSDAPPTDRLTDWVPDPEEERAALRLALGGAARAAAASLPPPAAGAPGLAGELCGDIDAQLAVLAEGPSTMPLLSVSCAGVTRVDFAAAGCLLDWAQQQRARGCQVQLLDVSPLVAIFLRSVGLTEHAQVTRRAS